MLSAGNGCACHARRVVHSTCDTAGDYVCLAFADVTSELNWNAGLWGSRKQ
jgi:hypothetical protein